MDEKHHLRHPRVSEIQDQQRTQGDQYTSGAAEGSWLEYATEAQAIQGSDNSIISSQH